MPNNCLHSDSHKGHGFCYSQKTVPLMASGEAGVELNRFAVEGGSTFLCTAFIKFFYEKTLKREWKFFELACPQKVRKLPVVLTSEEVRSILDLIRNPVPRVALTVIYSCGLRLSEGVNLLTQKSLNTLNTALSNLLPDH